MAFATKERQAHVDQSVAGPRQRYTLNGNVGSLR
jgi:hypothetical protein